MATLVLVGGRDAALDAALQQGHAVFYVAERKPLKRRRAHLIGHLQVDFDEHDEASFVQACIDAFPQHPQFADARAVIAVAERAVLPAAWLRSALQLPGNSAQSALWCRDKFAMKRRIRSAGIRCADFARIHGRTTAQSLIGRLGLPLVIKPLASSGSRGSTTARTQGEVEDALAVGHIAESYVHGLEMSVESYVVDGRVVFVNPTEYLLPLWANVVPAALPASVLNAVLELNQKAIEALDIQSGMTHLELFLTADGPVFSELAQRPPGGHLMELLARAYRFDPWRALFDSHLGLWPASSPQPQQHAGMWLLHPGEGTVKNVRGLRTGRAIAGVEDVQCRVKPGDNLARRLGSGESAAHVIATGASRDEVVTALNLARRSLWIDVERPRRSRSSRRRAA